MNPSNPSDFSLCSNCGNQVEKKDRYCANCGQKNYQLEITLKELLQDFVSEYFSVDSKLFKSLKPVFLKPGVIAREFMTGKRARYIPPLRFFIFTSFIYFLIWDINFDFGQEQKLMTKFNESGGVNLQAGSGRDSTEFISNDSLLAMAAKDSSAMKWALLKVLSDAGYSSVEIADSVIEADKYFEHKLFQQTAKFYQSDLNDFFRYTFGNLSIVIIILQPFFALLLLVLFFNSRRSKYISHLVFALYFHAFILILLTIFTIGTYFLSSILWYILVPLALILYLYKSIRNFYQQSRWASIWKMNVLLTIYGLVLIPTFAFLTFVSSFFFF